MLKKESKKHNQHASEQAWAPLDTSILKNQPFKVKTNEVTFCFYLINMISSGVLGLKVRINVKVLFESQNTGK